MHGPPGGGALNTRRIQWKGEKLLVNVDAENPAAENGELKVRVTDAKRKVIPGFDYDDCQTFNGDGVSHEITWKEKSIRSLGGQVIRLEFYLKNADLYTFRSAKN